MLERRAASHAYTAGTLIPLICPHVPPLPCLRDQMPVMDGYDATRAIRAAEIGSRHHMPIIALTANAMAGDHRKCLESGMDAYLTKPRDAKELIRTMNSLIKTDSG